MKRNEKIVKGSERGRVKEGKQGRTSAKEGPLDAAKEEARGEARNGAGLEVEDV